MLLRHLTTPLSLVAFGIGMLLPGCAEPRTDEAGDVLLGTLEFRDYEVDIFAGPLYTVEVRGKNLASRITREELKTRFPEIHQDIENLYAEGWAGLDGPDD